MSAAYYNEIDPYAAGWLRSLAAAGLIPAGDVDTRSIADVDPADLAGYAQCHFFAGIGGWPRALRLAGWGDGRPVWTGSCPCQPLSSAGLQKGHADERHLWPAFYRLIAECRPATVFGEQVAGALGREWLAGIRADLEDAGYAVGAADLCAAGVGAPHIRQRLFWVAQSAEPGRGAQPQRTDKPDGRQASEPGRLCGTERLGGAGGARLEERSGEPGGNGPQRPAAERAGGNAGGLGLSDSAGSFSGITAAAATRHGNPAIAAGDSAFWSRAEWLACLDGKARRVEPGIFPLADGVSARVGKLRAAGNAIVPQAAAAFIAAFREAAP